MEKLKSQVVYNGVHGGVAGRTPPDNWHLMDKINELVEAYNKLKENEPKQPL